MNALFIWIPKTAGTSVSRALCLPRFVGDLQEMRAFRNEGSATFGHAFIPSLINAGIINQKWFVNAFKFCFVRDPYDRMVSLYHHYQGRKRIKKGFKRFCRNMTKINDPIGPYNYRGFSQAQPQSQWIHPETDFVGRVENLAEDMGIVAARLGICTAELLRENRSVRNPTGDYYDKETEEIVTELYSSDFQMFGYQRGIL